MKSDLIGLLEAVYTEARSHADWQAHVLGSCRVLDEGLGVILAQSRLTATGLAHSFSIGTVEADLLKAFGDMSLNFQSLAAIVQRRGTTVPMLLQTLARGGGKTTSMLVGPDVLAQAYSPVMKSTGFRDFLGIHGLIDRTTLFGMYVPLRQARTMPSRLRRRLSLVGIHLAAGRRRWSASAPDSAFLTPDGHVVDAIGEAREDRDALSLRAKAIDTARTKKVRSDVDSALSLWEGLVAGKWSLVERFESDGKRYLVAKRNEPDLGNRLRLTPSEERVVKLSAIGHSQKYVAYALGLSPAMVSVHIASAMLKLRLRTRAELMAVGDMFLD